MDKEEMKYLVDVAEGRIPRDQARLDQLAKEGREREEAQEAMIEAEREKRKMTPTEVELELRAFHRKMFGPIYEKEHRRPLPGEEGYASLREHSAEERPKVPARLRLQCHSGEPIRQVLKTY